MFPVSSNFVNTPKRYDFSKCKDQRKTHFHEASKLGLQFSRNQWLVGTIGGWTWKREERALNRWWFGGVRWSMAFRAAAGSARLPGVDTGGGGDCGGGFGVGFEEEAEERRTVAAAKAEIA